MFLFPFVMTSSHLSQLSFKVKASLLKAFSETQKDITIG